MFAAHFQSRPKPPDYDEAWYEDPTDGQWYNQYDWYEDEMGEWVYDYRYGCWVIHIKLKVFRANSARSLDQLATMSLHKVKTAQGQH